MQLPEWVWGGNPPGFIAAAKLVGDGDLGAGRHRVHAAERGQRKGRPGIVTVRELVGPSAVDGALGLVREADLEVPEQVATLFRDTTKLSSWRRRIDEQIAADHTVGGFGASINLAQLDTLGASPDEVAGAVQAIVDRLGTMVVGPEMEQLFAAPTAHLVRRDPALMARFRLPAILIRLAHDDRLQNNDVAHIIDAHNRGENVFAASSALSAGVMLLDAYLGPLFGALTPYVWALPAVRASGTVVFVYGRAVRGTHDVVTEPLHLLVSRSGRGNPPLPQLRPGAGEAALTWWVRRLDKLLSTVSDPAVFSDAAGDYVPSKHLHALLSLDQLFRRTLSLQRADRDADARQVLCFTVLDTLNRLNGESVTEMATLSRAQKALKEVSAQMPGPAGDVLLPAAVRAVEALKTVQDGFYLDDGPIRFVNGEGASISLSREEAAAQWVRVMRNATHGHGSIFDEKKPQTDALLAQHDGEFPHDLALLGYLYLLELLSSPERVRNRLWDSGRI